MPSFMKVLVAVLPLAMASPSSWFKARQSELQCNVADNSQVLSLESFDYTSVYESNPKKYTSASVKFIATNKLLPVFDTADCSASPEQGLARGSFFKDERYPCKNQEESSAIKSADFIFNKERGDLEITQILKCSGNETTTERKWTGTADLKRDGLWKCGTTSAEGVTIHTCLLKKEVEVKFNAE